MASLSAKQKCVAKCLSRDDFWVGKSFGVTIASTVGIFTVVYRAAGHRNRVPTLEVTHLRGKTTTKEHWREICERAVVEQDPDRFIATIQELIQALEDDEERRSGATRLRVPLSEKPNQLSCPVA